MVELSCLFRAPSRHEVRVNGKILVAGDTRSVSVIFNNLCGGFKQPSARYLELMGTHFLQDADAIQPGQRVQIARPDGKVLFESTVCSANPKPVLPAMLLQ
ncbi:MAG: hypothetical protein EPN77_19355 [Candidimonas sp.]|nr:MAG: hypothetical protein EPN77_19355 [Candidimonas sp.]